MLSIENTMHAPRPLFLNPRLMRVFALVIWTLTLGISRDSLGMGSLKDLKDLRDQIILDLPEQRRARDAAEIRHMQYLLHVDALLDVIENSKNKIAENNKRLEALPNLIKTQKNIIEVNTNIISLETMWFDNPDNDNAGPSTRKEHHDSKVEAQRARTAAQEELGRLEAEQKQLPKDNKDLESDKSFANEMLPGAKSLAKDAKDEYERLKSLVESNEEFLRNVPGRIADLEESIADKEKPDTNDEDDEDSDDEDSDDSDDNDSDDSDDNDSDDSDDNSDAG